MNPHSESIKKFILIGLSLFLFKSVLIVFAYVFTQEQYNLFNQSYYTASLIILFASLGFNIAQTRIPLKTSVIFAFVSLNIVIAYFIFHLISKPFNNLWDVVPIIIYSLFTSVSGILNFKLLFEGKYQSYFIIMILFTISHFAIIPITLMFHFNIFMSLSVAVAIWFLLIVKIFDQGQNGINKINQYYKIGFSAFIINSAVSLGLTGDKYIVNHFFSTEIANTYTFAWGLTAPIFYIGNLIEKYLYAEVKPDKTRFLKKGFLLSSTLVIVYSVSIVLITEIFPWILPGSVSRLYFNKIFIFMITGYSIYVIFHFPINAFLFKIINTNKQKKISIGYSFIILIFLFVFYFMINYATSINYQILLSIVWLYIFILLSVKTLIIFKSDKGLHKKSEGSVTEEVQELT